MTPYIPQEGRQEIRLLVEELAERCMNVGELNYAISTLLHYYLGPEARYSDFNEVLGVLTAVTFELYSNRGPIGPYEARKKSENGPIP
jgi:hypothetical protein